jgi:hypothetical protein
MKALEGQITKLEGALKTQGEEMVKLQTKQAPARPKSIEDVIKENIPELKKIYQQKYGVIEIDLKAAGITAVTGGTSSIVAMDAPPSSPYLPGPGGELEMYHILRNPNFILNYVNVGRTALFRKPWLNEELIDGGAAQVAEGGAKPLFQVKYKTEFSEAKKIAGLVTMTEEFEADLPGLSSDVQRMLNEEVLRKWDDAVQAGVIAASPGFTLTDFDAKIDNADYYAAIGVGLAQITNKNFTSNLIALNPITAWMLNLVKGSDGHYVVPPFLARIAAKIVESNKVAVGNVFLGDLSQYRVDIYKDYVLKMGFINDDFAKNQFSIVGEVRYHDYISAKRKTALAYYGLDAVKAQILAA